MQMHFCRSPHAGTYTNSGCVSKISGSQHYGQKQAGVTHKAASCFAVSSGFFGGQWHEIHPQYWTKYQVWEWLQHLLDTNQLDASCIPFQEFDINGEHLCSMSLQEFTRAAGTAGQLLYSNLQHLKWNGQCSSDLFQSTHNVIVKTEQTDPSIMNTWKDENYLYDTNYGSTVDLLDSKTFCRAQISMTTTSHLPVAAFVQRGPVRVVYHLETGVDARPVAILSHPDGMLQLHPTTSREGE
ncbi:hypothetical protein P7K49_021938 [Saguinus oedipus]|uniref:PNT domain-containing protein n=1 Tax=Saguinus oedipus TaxID=9490 RepID=A0ABQ9UUZ3_SAGOE|nr:hypothetical protein P7K49_021938 [Saguinus oedipus]